MSRTARKNITASYIHVITQGIKKEYIFKEDAYKKEYIKLLKKTFQEYIHLYLLSYCIMDNHAHLLIYAENMTDLSKLMSRVNTSYGIFYNKQEERVGYVFRNRYYSQAIMNQEHLYNTVAYIHKNPVKANMVKEMDEYRYSSYHEMKSGKMEKESLDLLFHTDTYLKKFNWIHKNFIEENILEIQEKTISNEEIEKFIRSFCLHYKVQLNEIGKNNYLLNLVVNQLKGQYTVTNKQISEILGIGKNRITNMKKALHL